MRILILFTLLFSPFYLSAEADEQPSLMEALKMFYERNGGDIADLGLEEEKESQQITEVKGVLKTLFQEMKTEEEQDENEL